MPIFPCLFLAMLAVSLVARCHLASRQIRHVAARREHVPEDFADVVDAAAHRRAADYTCAKARVKRLSVIFDTALLLALEVATRFDDGRPFKTGVLQV